MSWLGSILSIPENIYKSVTNGASRAAKDPKFWQFVAVAAALFTAGASLSAAGAAGAAGTAGTAGGAAGGTAGGTGVVGASGMSNATAQALTSQGLASGLTSVEVTEGLALVNEGAVVATADGGLAAAETGASILTEGGALAEGSETVIAGLTANETIVAGQVAGGVLQAGGAYLSAQEASNSNKDQINWQKEQFAFNAANAGIDKSNSWNFKEWEGQLDATHQAYGDAIKARNSVVSNLGQMALGSIAVPAVQGATVNLEPPKAQQSITQVNPDSTYSAPANMTGSYVGSSSGSNTTSTTGAA